MYVVTEARKVTNTGSVDKWWRESQATWTSLLAHDLSKFLNPFYLSCFVYDKNSYDHKISASLIAMSIKEAGV